MLCQIVVVWSAVWHCAGGSRKQRRRHDVPRRQRVFGRFGFVPRPRAQLHGIGSKIAPLGRCKVTVAACVGAHGNLGTPRTARPGCNVISKRRKHGVDYRNRQLDCHCGVGGSRTHETTGVGTPLASATVANAPGHPVAVMRRRSTKRRCHGWTSTAAACSVATSIYGYQPVEIEVNV